MMLSDWATTRKLYAVRHYRALAASGSRWNRVFLRPWFRVVPNHDYAMFALYVGGGFARNNSALASPVTHNQITFKSSFQTTALDGIGASLSENSNANAIDVLFKAD